MLLLLDWCDSGWWAYDEVSDLVFWIWYWKSKTSNAWITKTEFTKHCLVWLCLPDAIIQRRQSGFAPKAEFFFSEHFYLYHASKAAFDRVSFHDNYAISLSRHSLHLSKELKKQEKDEGKTPQFLSRTIFQRGAWAGEARAGWVDKDGIMNIKCILTVLNAY